MWGTIKDRVRGISREEREYRDKMKQERRDSALEEIHKLSEIISTDIKILEISQGKKYLSNYDKRSGQSIRYKTLVKYKGKQYTHTDDYFGYTYEPNGMVLLKHMFLVAGLNPQDERLYCQIDCGMDWYERNMRGLDRPHEVRENLKRIFGEEYEYISQLFHTVR